MADEKLKKIEDVRIAIKKIWDDYLHSRDLKTILPSSEIERLEKELEALDLEYIYGDAFSRESLKLSPGI